MKLLVSLASLALSAQAIASLPAPVSHKQAPKLHSVAPFVQMTKYTIMDQSLSDTVFGIGYRYTQPSGYNTKIDLSLFHTANTEQTGHFCFDNSFRFPVNGSLDFYPFASLTHRVLGLAPISPKADGAFYQKVDVLGGIGCDLWINESVKAGLKIGLSKDIVAAHTQVAGDCSVTYKMDKESGYYIGLPISANIRERMHIEFYPSYWKSFNVTEEEKSLRISVGYSL